MLAQIFSFATRGQIKEKEEGLFVPFEEEKIAEMKEMLKVSEFIGDRWSFLYIDSFLWK